MNSLVQMLENREPKIETRVARFSSVDGVSGLGNNPFVSVKICSMQVSNLSLYSTGP